MYNPAGGKRDRYLYPELLPTSIRVVGVCWQSVERKFYQCQ
jgi:hypothetical protein